ncbi:MAG: MEDS domain-containing protein [Nocardioidaceae bacterium]
MVQLGPIEKGCYSHDLLLHQCDQELLDGTLAFVEQGLASGDQVLVHSTEERVAMLRDLLGSHPRLEYGFDRDLYLSPSTTLFAYERKLASEPGELWVTGTVPFGEDHAAHPAWSRYESMVNQVLGQYPFHALCTYDVRALPAQTIAAARATHPGLGFGVGRTSSPDYLSPEAFLTDPRAGVPDPSDTRPTVAATFHSLDDLGRARRLVARSAESASAVARSTIEDFITAMNEVLGNGLQHGGAPVELAVWVDTLKLTCRITDSGPGIENTLAGYRFPDASCPKGLWLARQLCEDLIIRNRAGRGCEVILSTG